MLEKFLANGRNSKDFWTEVRKSKNVVPNHPCVIDGICDRNEIVNFFSDKYRNVLDNPECQIPCDREELHSPYNACNISVHDVCDAIDKLKTGIGWDRIYAKP